MKHAYYGKENFMDFQTFLTDLCVVSSHKDDNHIFKFFPQNDYWEAWIIQNIILLLKWVLISYAQTELSNMEKTPIQQV